MLSCTLQFVYYLIFISYWFLWYHYILYIGIPVKPTVNVSSPVHLSISNFTLSMKCIPENNNFNYTWEKRIGDLSLQTTGVNSSCLTIFNLRPEDSGEYRCIMSNSTGRCASDYTELSVYGKTCLCIVRM